MSPRVPGVAAIMLMTAAGFAMAGPIVTSGQSVPQFVQLPIAEANDLRFVRLSSAPGVAATPGHLMIQDEDGFLWFGSDFGLSRYDGYRYKLFTPDPNNGNSLADAHITSLFKDHSGFLWIGTDQMVDRFDPRTETFTHYHLQIPDHRDLHVDPVHIDQDSNAAIWLATGSGLLKLDPRTGALRLFRHEASDPDSLTSNDIRSTFEDRQGRFWVANGAGLDEFDRRTGRVTRRVSLQGPVREFQVYQDHDGLLWLAYASGGGAGLSTFDPESNALTHYVFAGRDLAAVAYSGVYSIAEDQEGNLWIGTGGMGLLKLDRARKRFIRYRNRADDPETLSDDHVVSLLVDRQDNLWIGLFSTGPNLSGLRPPLFRQVIRNLGSKGGGEKLVYSVLLDHEGYRWIGSASGLFRLESESGVPDFVPTSKQGVGAGITAIAEDPTGDLWLGTVGQGLKRFDPRRQIVVKDYTHSDFDPHSLSDDLVTGLRFEGPGTLWVATWDGIDRLDIASGRFAVHKRDPQTRMESYRSLAQDAGGRLWIGGDSGLVRVRPSRLAIHTLRTLRQVRHDQQQSRQLGVRRRTGSSVGRNRKWSE